MMRIVFYIVSILSIILIGAIAPFWPHVLWFLVLVVPYIIMGLIDINSIHNLRVNYPVLAHLRYILEFVRPEIQQYFIHTDLNGRPLNREVRSLVYRRAKGVLDTVAFGTQHDITEVGYESANHSVVPVEFDHASMRITVGGDQCSKPYTASRLNISAMSFGALSINAIRALNLGAKEGNFAHNTGEGGLSDHHLKHGGDIIWQIGSGYFGCRTLEGDFCPGAFKEKATLDVVKMIEIKLSQGAKPGHGGVLPAAKVNREIATVRGVAIGEDCLSPAAHREFSTPIELLEFVQRLRDLSGGKPVGFKLCLGSRREFMAICKAMLETNILPDFITVDGAEGGSGAAPVEYCNHMGTTINDSIVFVRSCLQGIDVHDKIRLIASGKVASGFDMLTKLALGADMCNSARAMMFALGCVQSLRCNENTCPTGVATQDPVRNKALKVEDKYKRVASYHDRTLHSFGELCGAVGVSNPDDLGPQHINRRIADEQSCTYEHIFHYLIPGELLGKKIHPSYADDWAAAQAETFR